MTEDGAAIVVQRPTAQAVATAARAAVGCMTMNDVNELEAQSSAFDRGQLVAVVLADWIARSLRLSDDKRTQVREMVGRSGVARG